MNSSYNGQSFPRKLSEIEKYWLYKILPENRSIYKIYRDKIDKLYVIGYGKFPPFNLVLGNKDDQPDLTIPSQPIIATGTFRYNKGKVDVTIFEEAENQIEIDIHSDQFYYFDLNQSEIMNKEISWFTYSNWLPGLNHPEDNSELRLIIIEKDKFCLAISPNHKRIWIYDYKTQALKFLPITNLYQELLKILKIHDPKLITNINYFFQNLNKFSDSQIKDAFLNYNRLWKKVEIVQQKEEKKKENFFKKLFARILWKK